MTNKVRVAIAAALVILWWLALGSYLQVHPHATLLFELLLAFLADVGRFVGWLFLWIGVPVAMYWVVVHAKFSSTDCDEDIYDW